MSYSEVAGECSVSDLTIIARLVSSHCDTGAVIM